MVKATTSRPTTETRSGLQCRGILRPTTVSSPGCRNPLYPLLFSWVRETARDLGWAEQAKALKCVTSSFKKKIGARKWARKQCCSLEECFLKCAAGASLCGCPLGQALTWQAPSCSPGPQAVGCRFCSRGYLKLCLHARRGEPFRPGTSAGQAGLELGSSEELPISSYLVEGSLARALQFETILFLYFQKSPNTCIYFYFLYLSPKTCAFEF